MNGDHRRTCFWVLITAGLTLCLPALAEPLFDGKTLDNWEGDDALAGELDAIVKNLAAQVSIAASRGTLVQPTLSVS